MCICLIFILIIICLIKDNVTHDVPFIPVRKRALQSVIDSLELYPGSILYDLGSGDGRVLIEAIRRNPEIVALGVENGIIPFLISIIRTHKYPISIKFRKILKQNISNATHIFCYLSDKSLLELQMKIEAECKKGTRIVSCDFQFHGWVPKTTISISNSNDKLSRMLYVYEK